MSHGQEVPSKTIGSVDACPSFGGNEVYTPEEHLRVYVNFGIPGQINLDQVDASFDTLPTDLAVRARFGGVNLTFVKQAWIQGMCQYDCDAFLGLNGQALFISEKVIANGSLETLLTQFYAQYSH